MLTIGRSLCSTAALALVAALTGSALAWRALALWFGAQFALIQALKVHSWWPPPVGRATLLVAVLATAVAVLADPAALTTSASSAGARPAARGAPSAARPLLGSVALGASGHAELERLAPLARLRVVGGRVYDEASLVATYTFLDRVLALRRPFTVLWDPRRVLLPRLSGRMFGMIRAWVDRNAPLWDTHVQAHALLLTNPLVRSLARLVIKLFAPPQPVRIVKDEDEALAFHTSCCTKTRSWVKASYADRDQRFSLFGAAWGGV